MPALLVWNRLARDRWARLSLAVGLISQGIALALGVTLGLCSGSHGRWVEGLIMRVADVTLAFPSLLLLIAIAAAVKPSLPAVFVVIGVVGWAGMARLVRGQVLVVRRLEYVQAARALGASDVRIIGRHLLPNVVAPVIVAATLGIGGAIMVEAGLSFIGLGAPPPTPSWGPRGPGHESARGRPARRARRPLRMTDIAYHPTRVKALRESFRALRAAEFPWTADTVYLNNAAIGPIPERTRRALG